MAKYQITTSASESTKIHANEKANINAGAAISVFGIHLMAAVEKQADATRFLVCPSTENPKQSVSLASILKDAEIEDKKDSIDGVIKFLGFPGGVDKTFVDVYQAFFYYSSSENDKAGANKDIDKEYAFSLGITNEFKPEPTEPLPFSIESISFSLWNSTREKVVNSLGTYSIEDMLEKFN